MTGDPEEQPGDDNGRSGSPPTALGEEEIEALSRRVSSAVRRSCPTWLAGQAEDIAQDVLMKLLKKQDSGEGKRTFSTLYLEKSAYGAVVDEIRRVCRRKEDRVEDVTLANRSVSERAGPDRSSYGGEIAAGILSCLKGLSRSRKLAVTLYLHGCTVPETASRLKWHLKRTESHVYRGLADLRNCLAERGIRP
jgi:RNA polymerase sigma-70 factor (ECF subfamily)